ncbi:aromatic compound degradation protein PaaI [Microterricola viridarii]|uniref:Aromatic compound degradation protein PaaI n=2 Tax=Microterricola viridarii TaxID=412690 RepID=A0A0Y0NKF2_9MICO|nr:aromatic compound degradation protein PaaI [Microterricola viridarii]
MEDVRASHEGELRAMLLRDRVAVTLGLQLVVDEPGHAVITMVVRDDMLNGFDVMHGGLIFSLADTAFAVACNEDEQVTLAAGAEISFLRPVRIGQQLTATAVRRTRTGRSGIYDVQVVDEAGHVVAEFRGRSRTTRLPAPAPGNSDGADRGTP